MPYASGDNPAVFEAIMNTCSEVGFELPVNITDLTRDIVELDKFTARQTRLRITYQGRRIGTSLRRKLSPCGTMLLI